MVEKFAKMTGGDEDTIKLINIFDEKIEELEEVFEESLNGNGDVKGLLLAMKTVEFK